ncbi:hypothetical protein VMT65_29795 [Nocardia sp. CDC153]|uniref:hypothetical protein n=1 Tax=Nocardia sp. CDC153 TaxID=3112167 RepID=UPI002DBFF524|nr:hypothetical protein [Nocardia sp. CDC153]MEC3957260.1 hypothetical protein [Nocardia sp. CDC153]
MKPLNENLDGPGGNRLPWPSEFGSERPSGKVIAGLVVIALAVPLFASTCWSAIQNHQWSVAFFGAAGTFGSLVFAVLGLSILRRRRSRIPDAIRLETIDAVPGQTIPARKSTLIALLCFASVAVLVAASRLILLLGNGLSDHAGRNIFSSLTMIVLLLAGLWLLAVGVSVASTPRGLRLTTEGLEFRNGFVHQRLPWSAVAVVRPVIVSRNPAIRVLPTDPSTLSLEFTSRLKQRTGLDCIVIPPSVYGIDPALLYYTIDFYARHPESRSELASDAAVQRMRRGDVLG